MSKIKIANEETIMMDWIRDGFTEEEAVSKWEELKQNFELGIDRGFYMDANGQIFTTPEHAAGIEADYGIQFISVELS